MQEIRVGYGKVVRGRLDGGAGAMTAELDEDGTLTIRANPSPDKFTMHVQTWNVLNWQDVVPTGNLGGMRIEPRFHCETHVLYPSIIFVLNFQ